MPYNTFFKLIALHAGTPIEIFQATLTLMFVVLGVILIGISFGLFAKNKESLRLHRWIMFTAVGLACIAIFLVMTPSIFRFYIDPDVKFFSSV